MFEITFWFCRHTLTGDVRSMMPVWAKVPDTKDVIRLRAAQIAKTLGPAWEFVGYQLGWAYEWNDVSGTGRKMEIAQN